MEVYPSKKRLSESIFADVKFGINERFVLVTASNVLFEGRSIILFVTKVRQGRSGLEPIIEHPSHFSR